MPNKFPKKKGWKLPKQKYKINNWHDYNEFLKQRGNIEIWLSKDVIAINSTGLKRFERD